MSYNRDKLQYINLDREKGGLGGASYNRSKLHKKTY